jgi:hypothetical protein
MGLISNVIRLANRKMLTDLLSHLLFTMLLSEFVEKMSEEDRKKYDTGKKCSMSRCTPYHDHDKHVEFYEEVIKNIKDKVEEELESIGFLLSNQFFKGCELSGFPAEFCNAKDATSIVFMLFHQMNKSNGLMSTDPASPNFIALLQEYERLGSIFNKGIVGLFLYRFNMESEVLDKVNQMSRKEENDLTPFFDSLLQVGSPEFILLQAQAMLYAAQTEEDSEKLQIILSDLSLRLHTLQISLTLTPSQKFEYLIVLVPLLIIFLDTPTWRTFPRIMVENFRVLLTSLFSFAEEIVATTSDQRYDDILQQKFPESVSSIPCRKDLLQFLKEKLCGKYEALKPK